MVRKNSLYKRVISKDNLIHAWDNVRYDSTNDFAPDCIGYDDIGANINELIKSIYNRLSSNSYQALPLKYVDVPKSTFAVRPGSIPEIEDRLVSYAILNVIAPIIDKKISDSVYSFRVKKDYKESRKGLFEERKEIPYLKKKTLRISMPIEDWFYEWPAFYEISKRLYELEGYNFLTISDVSAYFENIDHELLKTHLLLLLPNDEKTINLLMEILERWVWKSGTLRRLQKGIPQGNDVSSFLGNVFLMPLDEKFEEYSKTHDIIYTRYMDDIRIFSKSEEVAKDVLFVMNNCLRDLGLNIQGYKVQILKGKEIEKELFPPGMDELNKTIENINNAIQHGKLSTTSRKQYEKEVNEHFKKLSRKRKWEKNDWRLFSRVLTGFKLLKSKKAIKKCLSIIETNPEFRINTKIINYFTIFPDNDEIIHHLTDFLLSPLNKFDLQEAHMFFLFRYMDKIPTELFIYMYKVAFDERKNWFNRCAALVAIGSLKLDAKVLGKLRNLYDKESNTDIRRAIALCMVQLDKKNLISFIKKLRSELDHHLTIVGSYYEKVIYDKENFAQKQISMMEKVSPHTTFYKDHFYTFYLLAKVDKRSIKQSFAKLLKKNYGEVKRGKFKEQIRYLYKEVTNVEL